MVSPSVILSAAKNPERCGQPIPSGWQTVASLGNFAALRMTNCFSGAPGNFFAEWFARVCKKNLKKETVRIWPASKIKKF
jgi:hypothetical protein